MSMTMITQRGTIRASHPVREDFAGVSTDGSGCSSYFETKGHAVRAYEKVLDTYGLCFNPDDFMQMPGDDGRITIDIWIVSGRDDDYFHDCVGHALLMWHRMDHSGHYELTGYIA